MMDELEQLRQEVAELRLRVPQVGAEEGNAVVDRDEGALPRLGTGRADSRLSTPLATETAALERRVRETDNQNIRLQRMLDDAVAENEVLRQTVRAMQRAESAGSLDSSKMKSSRGASTGAVQPSGSSSAESRLAELREDFDELSQENWELLQENERAGTELALLREERGALDSAYAELSQHCEALEQKIENLEEVFTTSEAQEHGHVSNLPTRPMSGSDWGLLGQSTNHPATPIAGRASMRPGPQRGETVVDAAADALLRQAGTYY